MTQVLHEGEGWITIREAARVLGVTHGRVYQLTWARKVRRFRRSGRYYVAITDVRKHLATREPYLFPGADGRHGNFGPRRRRPAPARRTA